MTKSFKIYLSVICALCALFIAFHFLFQPVIVVGDSMEPTLQSGNILITSTSVSVDDIERDDIVCAWTGEKTIIKRVVGIPGDVVCAYDETLWVNGEAIATDSTIEDFDVIELGGDEYYLLGDNIEVSLDSRYYGTFTIDDISNIIIKKLFKGDL